MGEESIFQKEEELLEFGTRFMEKHGPNSDNPHFCTEKKVNICSNYDIFYSAFKRVFTNYKKLFKQTTRLIRLSDRQQLKLDTANQSLKESQAQLKRRNEFIRSIFSRYMSDEVVESILETPEGLQMGGENKQVTVVMSDLRAFTAISETLPAEKVVDIVNLYLEAMTEIIFKHQGNINSFLGDGIMIIFGAPISREDDTERAVACALEMQQAMPEINKSNKKRGYPELSMGIGIHTGMVVAGNIGSQKRSHYTVMGKVVNLAARIESYSVGGQILISESTRKICHPLLQIDDSMEATPKGFDQPITFHQVSAIGGHYDIRLAGQKKVVFKTLTETVPIHFAILSGKHSGKLQHIGEISSLSATGARIKTDVAVPQFTNLTIALYHHDQEHSQTFSGKVMRGTSDEVHWIEVTFTFLPPSVQTFFKATLEADGSLQKQPFNAAISSNQPTVNPQTSIKLQESRASPRRRHTKSTVLSIILEDGSILQTTVHDFSLEGMFLSTGAQKPPSLGTKGSFEVAYHDSVHRFPFEVAHGYQNGIGIRITQDHDIFSLALLDGAFGEFFPVES